MSDDSSSYISRRGPAPDNEPMLEMIARAYDKARTAYSDSVVARDFRLDLSPDRRRELESEREAARSRVFDDF